ncbi:fibronectin type III domain-containing protein [Natrinema salaciae]
MTGTVGAASSAHFGLDDGFADTSWLEEEDVQVLTVTEPTREALEEAFHASGPRVVVFETSGTIDLGGETLQITEDNCWVAGQTAPSPGITFTRGMVQVDASNCVVQHIRSRIGPGSDGNIQGNDAFNTADETTNNVVDHVTASWGTDECMSVGYDTDRTTYANCLIYEGLYDPYGDGSDHNYCTLVGDGADRVALLGNIWSKARNRIPRLKSDTRSVVVNNFTYFFDEASNTDSSAVTAWVGNKYTGTAATGEQIVEGSGTVYGEDNVTADPALDSDVDFVEPSTVGSPPLWPDGLEPMPSSEVESHNLTNAGARPADRTEHDRRIVQEIEDRAGNDRLDSPYDYWVPNPDAVGGYPELPENTHSLSPPSSGLREWLMEWAAQVEAGDGNVDPGDGTEDDTTAPSPPSNVQSPDQTASSVDLDWDGASDSGGSGLSHYVVSVDDRSQQVPADTTSATVSDLEPETTYDVAVRAVDEAGNESDAATTTVTTDEEDSTDGGTRGSHFAPEDGFADTDWFDDDVEVITISDLAYEPIQQAFETAGPRLIVFEESGVLDLDSQTLEISEPNCWVAGQTAPSPGVTFIDGFVQIDADNVVMEHVRCLRGDQSGGEGTDPMNSSDGTENVIFNHCTAFWGRDENLSVGYDSTDTTLANCMIAEGLEDPEENSNGTLVGDGAKNVAILGTVYAKNNDRNPRLKPDTETVVVNGLNFYHDKAIWISEGAEAAVVGNAYIHRFSFRDPIVFGDGSVHMDDNYVADPPLNGRPFSDVGTELDSPPLWPSGLEALPASQTEAHNLANAGARPAERIDQEAKIVQQIEDRWGSLDVDPNRDNAGFSDIPDSAAEAGGYPDHGGTTRTLDVPDSGLRQWLDEMAAQVEPDYDTGQSDTEAPTTPSGLTVTDSTLSSIEIDWEASTDAGGSGIWRYNVLVDGQQRTSVKPDATSTRLGGLESGVDYEIGVRAIDAAGNESETATVTASTESADEDRTGGAGPITVEGGGEDIWNASDEFHYYYGATTGDFDVAVRVDALENTDAYAKAGLMVRESLDADAANLMIRRRPDSTSVQWRPTTGAESTSLTSDAGESESEVDGGTTDHAWQRLVREGDTLRAYGSDNGQNWTLLASVSLSLATNVHVGLAVTSHASGTLTTAEFDSWSGLTLTDNQDVGDVDVSGSVTGEAPAGDDSTGDDGTSDDAIAVGQYEAQDTTGDGLYNDIDGDGKTTHSDVNALFDNLESEGVQDNPERFDFDENDRVGFTDVLELLRRI